MNEAPPKKQNLHDRLRAIPLGGHIVLTSAVDGKAVYYAISRAVKQDRRKYEHYDAENGKDVVVAVKDKITAAKK